MGFWNFFTRKKSSTQAEQNMNTCPYCNAIIINNNRNCPGCGNFLSKADIKSNKVESQNEH